MYCDWLYICREEIYRYHPFHRPRREKAKYKTHTYKFKKFTRSERRMLIERLEQSTCDASEMALKAERWKRLGEILHIGDYARRYPRSVQAINSVRNDQACSWYAQVAAANSIKEKIDILSQRPASMFVASTYCCAKPITRVIEELLSTHSPNSYPMYRARFYMSYTTTSCAVPTPMPYAPYNSRIVARLYSSMRCHR